MSGDVLRVTCTGVPGRKGVDSMPGTSSVLPEEREKQRNSRKSGKGRNHLKRIGCASRSRGVNTGEYGTPSASAAQFPYQPGLSGLIGPTLKISVFG